jgi:hypothetical protein
MRKLILKLLDKIPYHTKFGLSLSDLLKIWWYKNINQERCLCGGYIMDYQFLRSDGDGGWFTECKDCNMLYSED